MKRLFVAGICAGLIVGQAAIAFAQTNSSEPKTAPNPPAAQTAPNPPAANAMPPAASATAPVVGKAGALTDARGMTLYTYDKDTTGKSTCTGTCAQSWLPLTASSDAKPSGNYTIVTRDDGTKQWAYNGKPLYLWKGDTKPGDQTGNGMAQNSWHVATAAAAPGAASGAAPASK